MQAFWVRVFDALFFVVLPLMMMFHAGFVLGGWVGVLSVALMLGLCCGLALAAVRAL